MVNPRWHKMNFLNQIAQLQTRASGWYWVLNRRVELVFITRLWIYFYMKKRQPGKLA